MTIITKDSTSLEAGHAGVTLGKKAS